MEEGMGMYMYRNTAQNKKSVITSVLGGLCACLYLCVYVAQEQLIGGNGQL